VPAVQLGGVDQRARLPVVIVALVLFRLQELVQAIGDLAVTASDLCRYIGAAAPSSKPVPITERAFGDNGDDHARL
jgi:hypothetical protein